MKKKRMWEEINSEMPNCLSLVVLSGSLMFLSDSRKGLVVFVMTLVNYSHSQEQIIISYFGVHAYSLLSEVAGLAN